MKPFRIPAPVLRSMSQRACTLRVSRAELERALGTPREHDAGEGLGPRLRWEHTWECGLELMVDVPAAPSSAPQEALVWMKHLEVEHLLSHLGLAHDRVLWRADLLEPQPLEGWAVLHQDSHGHRHDLCVLPVRDHAECMARLLEERSPHRCYDISPRGTPPPRLARSAVRPVRMVRPLPRIDAAPAHIVSG